MGPIVLGIRTWIVPKKLTASLAAGHQTEMHVNGQESEN